MVSGKVERKRQARGQARIQSLLLAAESVFARSGYSKATTNEIAAEAQVSPATLYQFFVNKEEIANSLAWNYAEQLAQLLDELDYESMVKLPTRDMVTALITPLLQFHQTHPAFLPLLIDAPLSAETWKAKHGIAEKFIAKMSHLYAMRDSTLSPEKAAWNAEITFLVYKGLLNEIRVATDARREKLIETLIELLSSYLEI